MYTFRFNPDVRRTARPSSRFTFLRVFCAVIISGGLAIFLIPTGNSAITGDPQSDAAQEYAVWLKFRDGSLIQATVPDQSVPWLTVQTDGRLIESTINIADIDQLYFTESPASELVAKARRWIDQLSSSEFHERDQAEKRLLAEGGPYVELIKLSRERISEPEARFRLERVLKHLTVTTGPKIELDTLNSDNRKLEGDVRDWKLVGKIGETPFALDRTALQHVYFENPLTTMIPASSQLAKQIEIQFFTSHEDHFFQEGQVHASFEQDQSGKRIARNQVAHELFHFLGLNLRCEHLGWDIIIAGFQFTNSVSRNNSIGTYFLDPETNNRSRYLGVTEITFCQPGFPKMPAAVEMAGLFLEIVVPRQHVIEAYNAAGHRIAMLETASERTSFLGLKSNEPISRIRVSPNYALNLPEEELNDDYAIDDICFRGLVRLTDLNRSDKFQLMFKTGEQLYCDMVHFEEGQVVVSDQRFADQPLRFEHGQLASISGPALQPTAMENVNETTDEPQYFFVMLSDGSIIKATDTDSNQVNSLDFGAIPWSRINGFWSGPVARYPGPLDFSHANTVAVYPTCRFLIKEFVIADGQFTIQPESLERMQQNAELKLGQPDPQVDFANDGLAFDFLSSPTVWLKIPTVVSAQSGIVRLKDGQQFVIDEVDDGFTLDSIEAQSVTISMGGVQLSLSIDDIAVLRLADDNP